MHTCNFHDRARCILKLLGYHEIQITPTSMVGGSVGGGTFGDLCAGVVINVGSKKWSIVIYN